MGSRRLRALLAETLPVLVAACARVLRRVTELQQLRDERSGRHQQGPSVAEPVLDGRTISGLLLTQVRALCARQWFGVVFVPCVL
jgi:hypothetical protein